MQTVTRFAPSPNGHLHLGHAYSAIFAHDIAKSASGRFLLRIEDIDRERSRPELSDEFRRDLEWLGLEWDEVPAQSTRFASYNRFLTEVLREGGRIYPCRCTRTEIAAAAKKSGPDGPIYPGTCRNADIDPLEENVTWRINVERSRQLQPEIVDLSWTDEVEGEQIADPDLFGDVVLMRKDGSPSYHLAVTLDDAVDGVTLITRGKDLFPASHIHRFLQAVGGLPVPRWHHHELLLDETGKKLAKSRNSPSLADRRLSGENGLMLAEQLRLQQLPVGT
ncbi:MAG: tRNA glutamyl-Q(34) synthetase GluQRS [Pseudomonadota bacterium]